MNKQIIEAKEEKKIYFYYYKDNGYKLYRVCNGKTLELKNITESEISLKRQKQSCHSVNSSSSLWVALPEIKIMMKKTDKDYDMLSKDIDKYCERAYEIFTNDARKIKALTNGKINMFKIADFKKIALKFFYDTVKDIKTEPIDHDEAEFILKSTIGSIMVCEKGFRGKSYHYDFKSYYPSIMQRQQTKYPIKRGEFLTLTQKEFDEMEFMKFGIYRAKVTSNNKYFRVNPENYYTHTDLQYAKDQKMKIEIIEVEKNFLYYSSDKLMNGNKLFKEFVSTFYPIRKEATCAKIILNILWGSLIEKTYELKEYDLSEECSIPEKAIIKEMYNSNNGTMIVRYTMPGQSLYKHEYGRIGTFLLAYGRKQILKTIEPFIDDVVYIHTDGFRCKHKQDLVLGENIGDLEYEGKDKVEIISIKKIIKI